MPLPLILIGAAVAATAVGAKKAYDGHQDKSLADDIIERSKNIYKKHKEALDEVNNKTSQSLESLGELELKIGSDFDKFDRLVEEILKNNNFQKYSDTKIQIPQHKLNQIKEVAITATDYLKTVVGGGVSGAAAGFAVYGGVMALGAASTGTSIASLSGVAAYNATMAAIGGGSLAAGGWGMAGGAMVLGGAVVAPVLAVAGIAYAIHGSKALKNAKNVEDAKLEANELIKYLKSSGNSSFELPIFYDIEEDSQISYGKKAITDITIAFCETMKNAGYEVGVYSYSYWLNNYMETLRLPADYSLWGADYGTNNNGQIPSDLDKYSETYDIWQFTDKAQIDGINGYVDMNVCYKKYF